MLGGRKVRSNKGKKRGSYRKRISTSNVIVSVNDNGNRTVLSKRTRKVRSNKGKKRKPYGPRTGKTRSGRKFRGGADGHCEIKQGHTDHAISCIGREEQYCENSEQCEWVLKV